MTQGAYQVKKGYIAAAMVWLVALTVVMPIVDLIQSPGFQARMDIGLDDGIIVLDTFI
jgi:hypothetical protein